MNESDKRRRLTTLREDRGQELEKLEGLADQAKRGGLSKSGQDFAERVERRVDSLSREINDLELELGQEPTLEPGSTTLDDKARAGGREGAPERSKMIGGEGERVNGDGSPVRGRSTGRGGDLRSQALTVNEQAERMPDDAREKIARTLQADSDPDSRLARYVIAAGDQDYFGAFRKWFRDPLSGQYEWTPEEREAYALVQAEARVMGLGSGSGGGFLVPYELDPQILISSAGYIDPMRQLARVEQTAYNEARFVTSAGVTASWDPESQEVSDDSPTLAQPAITCHKGAAFVPVSIELDEDSDIARQVGALFVDAKTALEASAFTLGTGSGQPKGVITAVSAVGGSVVTAAGAALALADIKANQNALPPRWRSRAAWMANLSIINAAREIAKGSGLTESIVDDSTTPPKMLGWGLHENSNMDGTIAAGTTNDYVLLSGDFSQYIVADRVGATVEFVPHLFGANGRPKGERGFYMHFRTGGDVVIADAFRLTNYSA
jgi:HK97 family phage major capsid protein